MEQAGVAKPWYEYMMGNSLNPLDKAYSNPSQDQLMEAYKRAERYLSVTMVSKDMDDMKKELLLSMWRDLAKMMGVDPIKIQIEREKALGHEIGMDEEIEGIQEGIQELNITPQRMGVSIQENNNSIDAQVIGEDELVPYIEQGWDLIRELKDGRFVVCQRQVKNTQKRQVKSAEKWQTKNTEPTRWYLPSVINLVYRRGVVENARKMLSGSLY